MTMQRTARFWDKVSVKYADAPIKNLDSYQYTLERTRSYLRHSDKVLEIGAGTCSTALELAPMVGHITATDISPAMIDVGERNARDAGIQNIDFGVSDAMVEDLSGPYDVVLAHNILHLVEDLPATMARINAVLRPGGIFISKTFCRPSRFGSPTYHAMRIAVPVMQMFGKAPHVAFHKAEELEMAIERAGFAIQEATYGLKGDLRRYIVAKKIQRTGEPT